ncbi:hypothetical protein KKC44_04475 [Patescibacteria group bacterium]|nr:hypothetical protein [Patescibacteria group bacterium]MBU2259833.1 hypothetical protein [Patescibacteria group bacterium]
MPINSRKRFEDPIEKRMLPPEIIQIQQAVNALSLATKSKIQPLLNNLIELVMQTRIKNEWLDRTLIQAELDIKYLIFDLWATLNERDSAQQELDDD